MGAKKVELIRYEYLTKSNRKGKAQQTRKRKKHDVGNIPRDGDLLHPFDVSDADVSIEETQS